MSIFNHLKEPKLLTFSILKISFPNFNQKSRSSLKKTGCMDYFIWLHYLNCNLCSDVEVWHFLSAPVQLTLASNCTACVSQVVEESVNISPHFWLASSLIRCVKVTAVPFLGPEKCLLNLWLKHFAVSEIRHSAGVPSALWSTPYRQLLYRCLENYILKEPFLQWWVRDQCCTNIV